LISWFSAVQGTTKHVLAANILQIYYWSRQNRNTKTQNSQCNIEQDVSGPIQLVT
jgi:hypothetical protein